MFVTLGGSFDMNAGDGEIQRPLPRKELPAKPPQLPYRPEPTPWSNQRRAPRQFLGAFGNLGLVDGEAFDLAALEEALSTFLAGMDDLRLSLLESLGSFGWYPWLIALATVALALREYRRRNQRVKEEDHWPLIPGLAIP